MEATCDTHPAHDGGEPISTLSVKLLAPSGYTSCGKQQERSATKLEIFAYNFETGRPSIQKAYDNPNYGYEYSTIIEPATSTLYSVKILEKTVKKDGTPDFEQVEYWLR